MATLGDSFLTPVPANCGKRETAQSNFRPKSMACFLFFSKSAAQRSAGSESCPRFKHTTSASRAEVLTWFVTQLRKFIETRQGECIEDDPGVWLPISTRRIDFLSRVTIAGMAEFPLATLVMCLLFSRLARSRDYTSWVSSITKSKSAVAANVTSSGRRKSSRHKLL